MSEKPKGEFLAVAPTKDATLFNEDGGKLVGDSDHFVFDMTKAKPLLRPEARAHYLTMAEGFEEARVVQRVSVRNPTPRKVHQPGGKQKYWGERPPVDRVGWSPTGEPSDYITNCPLIEDEPLEVCFFMAATMLQSQINDDVQKFSRELRSYSLAMVTLVDTPIMAFPLPEKGFSLEARVRQYAIDPSDLLNRDEAVSIEGMVPIEPPSTIEFKYLILMQSQLREMGMIDKPEDLRKVKRAAAHHAFRIVERSNS